ncbi:MAG TPA: M20 family peptidase [Woeseiaceae bacterium]|nr:M20 family peptidase [Woeseiaceae bacterium]
MMLRILAGVLLALVLLAGVLLVNTLRVSSAAAGAAGAVESPALEEAALRRLSAAISHRTVSSGDSAGAPAPFSAFHAFLQDAFPRVHAELTHRRIGGLSLLYEWPGTDTAAKPVLFLAHQDVVPAADPGAWTHPPFSGAIEAGYVWGRGAMDDKSSLMGWLEAVEQLLASGFRPARTVYLAFGHDEETGGEAGAREIARYLASRGVQLEFVLDEGGFVGRGLMPGLAAPVALVGIAEKGYLTVELTATEEGGHSSRPPERTAIGMVSRAVARLEENPFPGRLDGATEAMFDRLAPHLPFGQRLVVANRWLLEPVLVAALESRTNTAPLVRTTTAATVFSAGEKDNVLARHATAMMNLRILPGETVDATLERIELVIDDPRVQVRTTTAVEPSPTSSTTSPAWKLLERSIREVLGDEIVVAPYLLVAGTDSKHFAPLADDVYRFFALTVTPDDVVRFHGIDERIAVEDYANVIAIYRRILGNLSRLH